MWIPRPAFVSCEATTQWLEKGGEGMRERRRDEGKGRGRAREKHDFSSLLISPCLTLTWPGEAKGRERCGEEKPAS